MLRSYLRTPQIVSRTSRTFQRRCPPSFRHPIILPHYPSAEPCYSVLVHRTSFHSTPRANMVPIIPLLASILKSSTALELARTAGRIALTFVPMLLFKNRMARKRLEHAHEHGTPAGHEALWEENKTRLAENIKKRTTLYQMLVLVPITLFFATITASLERTPLTGRWRLIILSPEEEDEIAAQLAGPGWYQAVGDILAQEGPVKLVSQNDWRFLWVRDTLRRLESTVPVLQREHEMDPEWLERGADDIPLPPPSEYPLRPRPRACEYLRHFVAILSDQTVPPVPHTVTGPPYSLLIVDKADASNAFSYGFGPDGGGGIVVYSGFLDDILSKLGPEHTSLVSSPEETSWWTFLLGSLFAFSHPPPTHPSPSPEQTSELAILLAHELAHLILSHHLETLSSGTVIVPGVMSMVADVARAVLFPITMMFGPFVNDAVAQLGKVGSGELVKVGEYCTSMKQEIEADVVSARLLAHAGFDARHAVLFWQSRQHTAKTAECSAAVAEKLTMDTSQPDGSVSVARQIMGSAHPVNEVRVERLKEELLRWDTEKQNVLRRLQWERPREKSAQV